MEIILSQLRSMVSLKPDSKTEKKKYVILPSLIGIAEWEVWWLILNHFYYNIQTTRSTLESLYELLDRVSELPVEDHIKVHVDEALDHYNLALNLSQNGSYEEAITASSNAKVQAEKAFFDPTMLPLLYFPEEHLYAVYAPFFVPALVPVISATTKTLRPILNAMKAKFKRN